MTSYHTLPHHQLNQPVFVLSPPENNAAVITEESPAICGMTDLSQIRPLMIDPFATLTHANERMINYAVRMLFISQTQQQMIGIITATDILGEKPVKYMHEVGCTHADILVRDIMSPVTSLEALNLADVERGRIGDVIETLRNSGRQHALVVETDADARIEHVCGIFSTAHISRLMHARVEVAEVATSFAAIQSALS